MKSHIVLNEVSSLSGVLSLTWSDVYAIFFLLEFIKIITQKQTRVHAPKFLLHFLIFSARFELLTHNTTIASPMVI